MGNTKCLQLMREHTCHTEGTAEQGRCKRPHSTEKTDKELLGSESGEEESKLGALGFPLKEIKMF